MNIEALTYEIAFEACLEAELGGYGWDSSSPEDVAGFMPSARKKAERYANILSVAK